MNLLFTSAGRRVELLRSFRRILRPADGDFIFAADVDRTAPALLEADRAFLVPPVSNPSYKDYLIKLCKTNEVNVVIPLIDPELPVLAMAKEEFAQYGIVVLVSDYHSIAIADDKLATARFFQEHSVPTADTWSREELLQGPQLGGLQYPVIIKPRHGSSGAGVVKCSDPQELQFYLTRHEDIVVQQHLDGHEVTIDLFGDGTGFIVAAVPRQRLKIRGGEVERGVTIDDKLFFPWVRKIGETFKPYGPINVQCFVTGEGPVFTEINPRFGGGYPLADAAGAMFPELVVRLVRGERLESRIGRYKQGLVMARYDAAFYRPIEDLLGGNRLTGDYHD